MGSKLRKHLHTGGLLVLLLLTASLGWGQGHETFTNVPTTTPGSYSARTWTGDNGEDWNATDARTDQTIVGKAITVRNGELSTTILGGIGNLTISTQRKFSGGSGVVTISVNGTEVGTIPYDDTVQTTTINGINVSGNVTLLMETPGNGDRVAMDDLIWTSFGGGGNTTPFITNVSQSPASNAVTSSDAVVVSADIIDSDGIASAELHWGTVSGSLGNTIAMSLDAGNTYVIDSAIPAQADGTTVYYEIEATDNNGTPLTTTSPEQSYTVSDPLPFGIPYFNAFGNQTDYDNAVALGFEFTDATQNGSYVLIASGSIVSPAINFSLYTGLTVSFDLGTFGGGGGQLDVSVSNDNGANYTLLGTFSPTSSTPSDFEQIVDLSSLNGTNGRIKFEQTAGSSNSLRFKNLNIEESTGGNSGPVISNISQDPALVTSSDAVSVSADIEDLDGIASAELHWGTASGSLGNTIAMSLDSGDTYITNSVIPAQADGTTIYYEIEATDANGTPLTTTSPEQSYTVVDPASFTLPYANGLRNQVDYDEAVGYGFVFNNATLTTTGGGYIKINAGGNIVSPAIDFSSYDRLLVNFDLTTFGGTSGQELTVFVSNDNGANYTALDTFVVPGSYITFEQFIDVSSLNGTNGRIKFEMTAGTNAIRFRDITIQEFQGYFYSNGSWTPFDPSGNSTTADDLYINDGTATFTTDILAHNITVNIGATLEVEKILTIGGNINNNGDLVFVSTATGNGELAAVPSTSNINGNITVQRYMSHNRSYRMVSSPVTTGTTIHDNWQEGATSNTNDPNPGFGTHITGTLIDQEDGFDATATGNPSMFTVDVPNQMFVPIDNTDVNTLTAGEAYLLFVRGDRSIDLTNDLAANETILRAKGTLYSGTQTQNFDAVTAAGEFVMFGNPYQSAVDMTSVFSNPANSTNLNTAVYYVYDPTLADYGAYVTVSLPGGGNNTSGSNANQYLQPGQGGQIATLGAGVSSLVFNEIDKAPGAFTATSRWATDDMLIGQLYTLENFNTGGSVHDSFGIMFVEGNDNGISPFDAVKPMNFYENLGINHGGKMLSLESRDIPQPGEVFALFSDGYKNTDYVLKLILDGLDNLVFYLDDQFTGESTELEAGETTYSFSIDSNDPLSIATDRFSIRTEERLGVDENDLLAGIRLYPNPLTDNTFYINAPKLNGEHLNVNITDMTGRSIYTQSLECRSNTVTVPMRSDLASGIYFVTLKHGGEANTYRLIKE